MMATLSLSLVSFVILIFYFSAILVFTPDDREDKYIKKLLEKAFRLYDSHEKELFHFFKKRTGYIMVLFLYKILHSRMKYAKIEEKKR